MEYSIYLNQARCIDWKLTYPEAILCSYYSNEHNWVRTKINKSDGDYFCITIVKLIKDLPIIGTSKFPFSKALNALVEKGLFEKIIDEENSKTVFYRILPAAKVWWKYPEVSLASTIQNRSLIITNVFKELQVLLNDNTIIKELQVLLNDNTIIKELKVLSKIENVLSNNNDVLSNDNDVLSNDNLSYNYNHITNHITNNHNMEIDDDSLKNKNNTKENILKTEFDKLFQLFPETVNNTPKNLALAFGSYSKLTPSQRFDLLKAVKNYSNTKQVKDHQQKKTTNFIQSLNSFITKSYTEFVYGLPKNYSFEEKFEVPQKANGAQFETLTDYQVIINDIAVSAIEELNKFKLAKRILEEDDFRTNMVETYDDSKIKELFSEKEYEVILTIIGGIDAISRYEVGALAEALLENIEQEK